MALAVRLKGSGRWLWRYLRPPTGRPARRVVGGLCLIMGLGRIGVLSFAAETALPAPLYGWLSLVVGVGLWATAYGRLTGLGRGIAVVGMATLAALAVDVLAVGGRGSGTSGCILAYLAYVLLGEVVSQRVDTQS